MNRLLSHLRKNPNDIPYFEQAFDNMFDDFSSYDGWGTESQCDPRGDFRDNEWSLVDREVEGVDD